MPYTVILPAAAEPIHLDTAKTQCRVVDDTAEDAWFTRAITNARAYVETYTRRALVRRVIEVTLDAFPCEIELPVTPLRSVVAVRYLDTTGTERTLALADLREARRCEPPEITPAYGKVWPYTLPVEEAITVEAEVGHVAAVTAVNPTTDTLSAPGHALETGDRLFFTNNGGALPPPLRATAQYYAVGVAGDDFQVSATAGGAAIDITGQGTGLHFIGAIPPEIEQAMLMLIDHWYANRGVLSEDGQPFQIPHGVDDLLFPHRVQQF